MRRSRLWKAVIAFNLLGTAFATSTGSQVPQFGATVARVQVDVIVTDRDGDFVDDLGPGSFSLFEDGEQQEILQVQLVDLSAGQTRALKLSSGPSDNPTAGDEAPIRIHPGELGAVVFLIDMPGLFFKNKIRFADALVAVQQEANELRIPHAIYVVNQVGMLEELVPLTDSVDRLLEAGRELRAAPIAKSRDDILTLFEDYVAPRTDAVIATNRRLSNLAERDRSVDTYELLARVTGAFAARKGRTALVWVSTGVQMGSTDLLRSIPRSAQSSSERQAPERDWMYYQPDPRLEQLQEGLYRLANTENVSIYSVDPTTLADFYPNAGGTRRPRAGSSSDALGNSLRQAAQETGGEAFIGATNLEEVLRNIESDAGKFYLLTYAPLHNATEGYHEIKVAVERGGTEVRARKGYFHYSEAARRTRRINGALDLPGAVSGFEVLAESTRAWAGDGTPLLVLHLAVDRLEIAGLGEAEAQPARLFLFSTVRRPGGELVAQVQEPFEVNSVSRFLTKSVIWEVEPSEYEVAAVVIDETSNRLGATKVNVEIPDAAREWRTSDPTLRLDGASDEALAVVAGRIVEGQTLILYVEVYNGEQPVISGRIVAVAAGSAPPVGSASSKQETTIPGLDLFPLPLRQDNGIHRGSLPLPALPAGRHRLEVRVDDLPVGRESVFHIPLTVVPSYRRQ